MRRILWTLVFLLTSSPVFGDDWPQWLGPQRDGIWRETGILEKYPEGGPKVRWKADVGIGYAGPAVAGGKVYLTDRVLAAGASNPKNAFSRGKVAGTERVLCFDEATGKNLWKHEYDCVYSVSYAAGPRCTPVVADGRVYTLGAMGDLRCLDASSGELKWAKNFVKEYGVKVPLWGFAAHPLLDGNRLICLVGGEKEDGGREAVAMAFDKNTGQQLWKATEAQQPGYCPPMIYTFGKSRQLIIWHPESVNGLDPATGKVLWSVPFGLKAGLSIPTPRQQGNKLFLTAFYNSSLMLEVSDEPPAAKIVWKGNGKNERPDNTATLHSIMTTPYWEGEHIYGICSYGELRCLAAKDGSRLWESLIATSPKGVMSKNLDGKPMAGKRERWGHAFITPNEGRYFLFNEHGELIIAKMTPSGYEEIDRAKIVEPTNNDAGRPVVWMHPAYANKSAYIRNDKVLVCVSLAK